MNNEISRKIKEIIETMKNTRRSHKRNKKKLIKSKKERKNLRIKIKSYKKGQIIEKIV